MSEWKHTYNCPKCGNEVDATDPKNQLPKKICYQCPNCNGMIRKCDALKLMEQKDGIKRWSIINSLKDHIDPFTGEKLLEKDVGNGWVELVKESKMNCAIFPIKQCCNEIKKCHEVGDILIAVNEDDTEATLCYKDKNNVEQYSDTCIYCGKKLEIDPIAVKGDAL